MGLFFTLSISTTVKLILSQAYISSITDTLETALSVSTGSSWATQMGLFFTLIYIYNSKVNTESSLNILYYRHTENCPECFYMFILGHTDRISFTLIYIYNSKVNTESSLYILYYRHTGNCPECFYRLIMGHTDGAVLYTHLYLQQ